MLGCGPCPMPAPRGEDTTLNLDAVLVALGRDHGRQEEDAVLRPELWAASQNVRPPHGLPFLEPDYVTAACGDASLPPDATAATVAAARRIAADPVAMALAWHCHYVVFRAAVSWHDLRTSWPPLAPLVHEDAGLFNVLVVLSTMSELRALYAAHAIPAAVARDTLADVARHVRYYYQEHGYWGLDPYYVGWLRRHMRGEIYQLVRLQFEPRPFDLAVRAFRHVSTNTVVALSEDGVRYRADGQMDGAGGVHDPDGSWTAYVTVGEGAVCGYPIRPSGTALRHEVRLPLAEWRQVLAPGDPVLDIHIPDGAPLDFALCGESLQAALAFFPRHFPNQPFSAFACESWLLDARLEALLPPTSNLVRFQQEMYLLPISTDGTGALGYVFGNAATDLQSAARATTLQRAILDHVEAGGHLRGGGCFLLPRDLRWGQQVYRRQAFPW